MGIVEDGKCHGKEQRRKNVEDDKCYGKEQSRKNVQGKEVRRSAVLNL